MKIIALIGSHTCFLLGDLWSKWLLRGIGEYTYPIYSALMRTSMYLSDTYDLGVWEAPQHEPDAATPRDY